MVHSMTAFSLKENKLPSNTLLWEIRTVNHRFLGQHGDLRLAHGHFLNLNLHLAVVQIGACLQQVIVPVDQRVGHARKAVQGAVPDEI